MVVSARLASELWEAVTGCDLMMTPQSAPTKIQDSEFEVVRPDAAAMIESMRAFGYSVHTAVADLIDNSLSATAANIWVNFFWNGPNSYVSITDDGQGMSEQRLSDAMRLGSRNPLETRDASNLGRFGLGLKTASFSQARCLTVVSKAAGRRPACRRWDMDYVNASDEWRLLKTARPDADQALGFLATLDRGTTVVWRQQMDRVVDASDVDDERAHRRFLETVRGVEEHVAMIFHRFLGPPKPVTIWIDGTPVDPSDFFLTSHSTTQKLARETLKFKGERITVAPYVLPHHSRVTREEHERAAGPAGWNAQQGFYVYRNRRLLVPGDWLRLGFQKEEHCKLARIQIDLPNSLDGDWSIDVKKSSARPPGGLREDLRRIASVTRQRATKIYRHQGGEIARPTSQGYSYVWNRGVRRGKTFYKINRNHPLVLAASASNGDNAVIESLLRLVEETIPAPLIALDQSLRPEEKALPFEGAATKEIVAVLEKIYPGNLRAEGLSDSATRERIAAMEPFNQFPELVASYSGGGQVTVTTDQDTQRAFKLHGASC